MKKSWIIGIVIVIILVIGGIILATQMKNPGANTGTNGANLTPPSIPNMPGNTAAQTYNVAINNFAFSPAYLSIKAGDTVIWTNKDSAPHTVTSDAGSELGSSTLSTGNTYSHTFNTAGTFNYHCSIHTMMKAKIVVE